MPNSCCAPSSQRQSTTQLTAIAPSTKAPDLTNTKTLPGGPFWMGNEDEQARPEDGEGPVREVIIAPFAIDICAVTNAQFEKFVQETGYVSEAETFGWSYVFHRHLTAAAKAAARGVAGDAQWWIGVEGASWRHPEGPGSNLKKRETHPVVHVSWHDAQAFCAWSGKRLPTEAEWEYAARGGLEKKRYPWGDELMTRGKKGQPEHRCNIWQGKFPILDTGADGFTNTAPVKSFAPNGFGLYQTSGNAWEWCSDWFATVHPERDNPRGPENGTHKTIRGGSFLCHISYCNRYRVAARTCNTPDSTTAHCGFRCVCDVE